MEAAMEMLLKGEWKTAEERKGICRDENMFEWNLMEGELVYIDTSKLEFIIK